MDFNDSFSVGQIGENIVLEKIKKKYPKAFIDDRGGPFSGWDIYIPEIDEGVEVKLDYRSKYSGNLLIEVWMNGSLSALSKTKSKYWVIIDGYRYIWVKPLEIYRYIEIKELYRCKNILGKGDTKVKWGYLINRDDFVRYIYSLDKEDGHIEMIKENEVLHHSNFSKKLDYEEE